MKKALFLIPLLSFYFVNAQDPKTKPEEQQKKKQLEKYFRENNLSSLIPNTDIPNFLSQVPKATFSHTLPNGNKVYKLPQDNMPCIVPDISHYKMPDGRNVKPNMRWNMPNLSPRMELIPREKVK